MSLFESDPLFSAPQLWALPVSTGAVPASVDSFSMGALKVLDSVEPVGRTYHNIVYPPESEQLEADEALAALTEANDKLRKKIQQAAIDDYYALLDLSDKYFDATEEDIQNAFKKVNLLMHPDKAATAERADAEVRFMALQKGFETLSDPKSRVAYNSARPFDESIPGPKDGMASDADFFKAYGAVFARNGQYSSVKPVPELGDMTTSWEAVNEFYQFWYGFKSWREFTHMDTERVGDSASRDERRWAEQKNKKAREVLKKSETARVRKLVDRAYAIDPRVKAEKARQADSKKSKSMTAADRKKLELEEKKKAEEEAKKKAEEEAAAAKIASEEKKRIKKETYELKKAFKLELPSYSEIDADLAAKLVDAFTYEDGVALKEARAANPAEKNLLAFAPIKQLLDQVKSSM